MVFTEFHYSLARATFAAQPPPLPPSPATAPLPQGNLTNVMVWRLLDEDLSGRFEVDCGYRLDPKGRMNVSVRDHRLLPDKMPQDPQALVHLVQRAMPREMFNPDKHALDITVSEIYMSRDGEGGGGERGAGREGSCWHMPCTASFATASFARARTHKRTPTARFHRSNLNQRKPTLTQLNLSQHTPFPLGATKLSLATRFRRESIHPYGPNMERNKKFMDGSARLVRMRGSQLEGRLNVFRRQTELPSPPSTASPPSTPSTP